MDVHFSDVDFHIDVDFHDDEFHDVHSDADFHNVLCL